MPNNLTRCNPLGAKQPFATYTLAILWKVGQFSHIVGHEQVVLLLHCGLSLAHICGTQHFVQIQRIIQKCCHILLVYRTLSLS